MASASGQKRGVCGHAMASFDLHEWCTRCREKVIGSDPCVHGEEPCKYCVVLTPEQILKLSIPKYKIRKEKKGGSLQRYGYHRPTGHICHQSSFTANLYGEPSLEPEPLFSSTSGAPARSAARPELQK